MILDPSPLLDLVDGLTQTAAARWLGVSTATVHRWRHGQRGVGIWMADRVATNLGLHIEMLWPGVGADV